MRCIFLVVAFLLVVSGCVLVREEPADYQELIENQGHEKALIIIQREAEGGDPAALHMLGRYYQQGWGLLEVDHERAASLFEVAARLDHGEAMVSLGVLYEEGLGVEKNPEEAAEWYTRALETGNPAGAAARLAVLYLEGNGVTRDEGRAHDLLRRGEKHQDAEALYWLGRMYEEGRGMAVFKSDALRYYGDARDLGHEAALNRYQALYDAGVRETQEVMRREDIVETRVFEWINPAAPDNAAAGDLTGRFFDTASGISRLGVAQERPWLEARGKAKSSRLYRSATTTGIDHEPAAGHSKWILPNFDPGEASDRHRHEWQRIRLRFSLASDRKMAEFELPLEIRTNLAPGNAVSVILYHTGEAALKTRKSMKDSFLHYESEPDFQTKGPIDLEYWNDYRGNWHLVINDHLAGIGRMDPRKVLSGLSNHVFIEGDVAIHSFTVTEGRIDRQKPVPWLDRGRHARLEKAVIDRFLGTWLRAYLDEGTFSGNGEADSAGEPENPDFNALAASREGIPSDTGQWRYRDHERVYLRRMPFDWGDIVYAAYEDWQADVEQAELPEDERGRLKSVLTNAMNGNLPLLRQIIAPKHSYIGAVLVTVENDRGEILRIPAQYLLGMVDPEDDRISLKLLFNRMDRGGDYLFLGRGADMEAGRFELFAGRTAL